MENFNLVELGKDINHYALQYPSLKKVYIRRDGNVINIYLFTDKLSFIPEDIHKFEENLSKRHHPFQFDALVSPYQRIAVEKYAESHDLIPVNA